MLKNLRKYSALLGAFLICATLNAQHTQSSYTVIGVGDFNYGVLTPNSSMGGVGLSYNSRYFVNLMNPALFGQNENAVFHIGGSMDFRKFSHEAGNYSSSTGSFTDFAIAVPLEFKKWNLGIGYVPLSAVNYGYRITEPGPEQTTAVTGLTGDGGLDEVFVTNAFKLGDFYLGAKVGVVLGNIQRESRSFLEGNTNTAFGSTVIINRESYSDFRLQLGAAYKLGLSEDSYLNLGATYNLEAGVSGKLLRLLDQQSSGGNIFSRDTLLYDQERNITLPSRVAFGISYEKYQRFNLGLDFHSQDWSDYRNIDGDAETTLGRSYRIAVGGEIIPNSENPGFFGLLSYRFGVHLERTPYLVNTEQVNDFGISFGASLPLSAIWGLSAVNVGATIGRRGSVGNGLIRENYVKLNFGFSVQDITWFTRSKFN